VSRGAVGVAEDQRCLAERRSQPVVGRRRPGAPRQLALFLHLSGDYARARQLATEHGERRGVDAGVVRVGKGLPAPGGLVGPRVELKRRLEMLGSARRLGAAEREVLVGASEHAECLGVAEALGRQPREHAVGLLDVSAACEREALQLAQPHVCWLLAQSLLHDVVGEQRLALVQQALRGGCSTLRSGVRGWRRCHVCTGATAARLLLVATVLDVGGRDRAHWPSAVLCATLGTSRAAGRIVVADADASLRARRDLRQLPIARLPRDRDARASAAAFLDGGGRRGMRRLVTPVARGPGSCLRTEVRPGIDAYGGRQHEHAHACIAAVRDRHWGEGENDVARRERGCALARAHTCMNDAQNAHTHTERTDACTPRMERARANTNTRMHACTHTHI
jgi:hypothetical protein